MKKILFGIGIGLLAYALERKNAIGSMKAFRFIPVYDLVPNGGKSGRTNINFARGKKGVYLIKENDRIVYVGSSMSDLYKTAIRHFQQWNDRQYRVSYRNKLRTHRYSIRFVFLNESRIPHLEAGLIEKYKPRDNAQNESYVIELNPNKVQEVVDTFMDINIEVPF